MHRLSVRYIKATISDFRRISKSKVALVKKWLTLKKNLKSLVTLLSAGFAVSLMVIVYLALQPPKVIILDEAPFKPISVDLSPIKPQHSELPVAEVKAVTKPVEQPTGDCRTWIKQAGVTDIANAHDLIMRESGCNPNAVNPSSGACGLMQALPCDKMATHGSDYRTNPITQLRWGISYVESRYGSWAQANSFQRANGWY